MSSQKKFLPKLYPLNRDIYKTWYIEYTAHDGKRKKVYGKLNHLATVDERLIEATALIQQIKRLDIVGSPGTPAAQLIKDLSTVYDLRKAVWKSKTASAYQTHFHHFVLWHRTSGNQEINALQAAQYLSTIPHPTTRNNYRNNLKSLFGDLCRYFKTRYTDNPFAAVRKSPESRKTKEWFKPKHVEQLKKVIPAINPQLWLAVRIMHDCFARPNELRMLRVADILETGKLRITGEIAKTKKIRYVPIPAPLFAELRKQLRRCPDHHFIFSEGNLPGEKHLGRDTLSKRHASILKEYGYSKGFTFYSWKNTGAVKMMMMDRKPMRYISKCMGHHSLDMTDKYFESLGVDEMDNPIIFPDLNVKGKKKAPVETGAVYQN